ncbi:MAG: alpha/beta hydrolase [Chloroflexales bacterium]|nr:alpha/beta hydrolase [Chloroflexales bacterium]
MRVLFRALGVLGAMMLVLGVLVYVRLGMSGPQLQSAEPTIALTEISCDDAFRGARCGTVAAPLDYQDPTGDTIEVGFIYYSPVGFGADRRTAVQIVGGGPGLPISSEIKSAPVWVGQLALYNRGILAIDTRGVGMSTRLECDAFQSSVYAFDTGAIALCADQLGRDRIHYSTVNTARDFDRVRQALGIEQLDILAFSYGATLSAVYAAMYPDRVRTLTLDGVDPVTSYGDFMPTLYNAFRRQIRQFCDRSNECDPDDALDALDWAAEELRKAPRPLSLPENGELVYPQSAILDGAMLASLARDVPLRSQPPVAFRLPVLGAVLEARATGNWSSLEQVAIESLGFPSALVNTRTVNLAVTCPEERPLWTPSADIATRRAELLEAARNVPVGSFAPFTGEEWVMAPGSQMNHLECINWPAAPADRPTELKHEVGAWRSDMPVLILNGDFDMQTPHEDAKLAAAQFERVQYARLRNAGHAVLPSNTCAMGLWLEFVNNKSVADPDKCLNAHPIAVSIYANDVE